MGLVLSRLKLRDLEKMGIIDLLFRYFPIIDRAQCATPATPTQRAGVAYATPAPPLQAPLMMVHVHSLCGVVV